MEEYGTVTSSVASTSNALGLFNPTTNATKLGEGLVENGMAVNQSVRSNSKQGSYRSKGG